MQDTPIVENLDHLVEFQGIMTQQPPFMKFPTWLTMDNPLMAKYFADIAAARDNYIVFFMTQNADAQRAIPQSAMMRLKHLSEAVYNPYDYSINALGYAAGQIARVNQDWLAFIHSLVEESPDLDFSIDSCVDLGTPIQITGGQSLRKLLEGTLEVDVLHKHPNTESAFVSYAVRLVMNKMTKRAEVMRESLK